MTAQEVAESVVETFHADASQALDAMVKENKARNMKGVAVVAFVSGDKTQDWVSQVLGIGISAVFTPPLESVANDPPTIPEVENSRARRSRRRKRPGMTWPRKAPSPRTGKNACGAPRSPRLAPAIHQPTSLEESIGWMVADCRAMPHCWNDRCDWTGRGKPVRLGSDGWRARRSTKDYPHSRQGPGSAAVPSRG